MRVCLQLREHVNGPLRDIAMFTTVREAELAIEMIEEYDADTVRAGHYGVDPDEEAWQDYENTLRRVHLSGVAPKHGNATWRAIFAEAEAMAEHAKDPRVPESLRVHINETLAKTIQLKKDMGL